MKILVVDDESDIREIVSFYLEEYFKSKLEIKMADGSPKAIEYLNNESFDLVLSDHNMPLGVGSNIHQFISNNNIASKYVVCSSVDPIEMPDCYSPEKIFHNILKPNIEVGIKNLASKFELSDQVYENKGYIPIGINLLFAIKELPCDLFISLSDEKFIKCFHKGEVFSIQEKEKYQGREIFMLYAKIDENQFEILQLIKNTIAQILSNKSVPVEVKLIDSHQQVANLLVSYGFNDFSIDLAKTTIDHTAKLLMKSDESISKAWLRINCMGEYPSKLFVLQSTLCGILARKMSWTTESTLQKVVTATFFQDLNLESLPLIKLIDYDEFLSNKEMYSPKECENFLAHPIKAKEMISKIKGLSSDIDRILLEQHESPNGQGFPRKLNAQQISPLSAMLNLTGVLSKTILNSKKEDINFNEFFGCLTEKGYSKGHYKEIFTHAKVFFSTT